MSTAVILPSGELTYIPDFVGLSITAPVGYDAPVTQSFGVYSVTGRRHLGVDQSIPSYTPLRSVLPGTTISTYPYGYQVPGLGSDGSPGGYGSQVFLMHRIDGVGTFYSRYGHMARIDVRAGDMVLQGQQIGLSDDTGISSGPHVHWEMLLSDGWTRFDPWGYIDRVWTPPIPTEEEQLEMSFTTDELASLHKLAELDANGKTFAPGTPGRSLLILMMDTYAGLDDVAREKFDRRMTRLLRAMGGPVTSQPDAAKVLAAWTYALTLEGV